MKKKNSKNKVEIKVNNETWNPSVKRVGIKSFCAWDGDVLVLNVLGTPSSKQDAIGKPKVINSKSVSLQHQKLEKLQIIWLNS
jgi:hypothetical protein